MRRIYFALYFAAGVFAASAWAAEPVEIVRAALQDFLDQPNYTWGVAATRGVPETNGEETDLLVDGQHEKGGYTKITFREGAYIPNGVSKPWHGFMDREDDMSARWIFSTPEGWRWLGQLPPPPTPSPSSPPSSSRSSPIKLGGKLPGISIPGASGSVGGTRTGSSTRITFGRKMGFRRPDHEIAIVLAGLDEVSQVSPGVFDAALTSKAAAELLFMGPSFLGVRLVSVDQATARVTVHVRKGQLVRYVVDGAGFISFGGSRRSVTKVLTRDVLNLGTTVIEVPAEVRTMMGEELAGTP
jgi:hypothetical protein